MASESNTRELAGLQSIIDEIFELNLPEDVHKTVNFDTCNIIFSANLLNLIKSGEENISNLFNMNANILDMTFEIKVDTSKIHEYNCVVKFMPGVKILAEKFYAKIIIPNADESMSRCDAGFFYLSQDTLLTVIANKIRLPNICRMRVENSEISVSNNLAFISFGNENVKRPLFISMRNLFAIEIVIPNNEGLLHEDSAVLLLRKPNKCYNLGNYEYDSEEVFNSFIIYIGKVDVPFENSFVQIKQVSALPCKSASNLQIVGS
jgi:hypothetical protein